MCWGQGQGSAWFRSLRTHDPSPAAVLYHVSHTGFPKHQTKLNLSLAIVPPPSHTALVPGLMHIPKFELVFAWLPSGGKPHK